MKNIIFIAPPAAGKGTQSEFLSKKYEYECISVGDLLREEVKKGSENGLELKSIMDSGKLVPDEIVTSLLKEKLKTLDKNKNFLLDGYPRNIEQAKNLNGVLAEVGINIEAAIYLELDLETAMHRALGRLNCPNCSKGYNIYDEHLKPKVENICDECGSELKSRSDDNEATFRNRFDTFMENTLPLLDYYRENGILYVVTNCGTPEEIFAEIESVIK